MTAIAEALPELEPNHPISVLYHWDESPVGEDTLNFIIAATTDFYAGQAGLGKTTHDLATLHTVVRGHCADRFGELSEAQPSKSKEEINNDPYLFALNAVRRTLHQAMVRRQNQVTKPRQLMYKRNK